MGRGFQVWIFLHPLGWKKNLKISPWEGNSNLPLAYGPWEDRVSSLGLIFGGFFNPWDEEISIPESHGPFGNFTPVGVTKRYFYFMLQFDLLKKKEIACTSKILWNCPSFNFLHMQKSDFFSLVHRRFHKSFENVWKFLNDHRLYWLIQE